MKVANKTIAIVHIFLFYKRSTLMEITFLETSDIHGYVYPTDFVDTKEAANGAAKVAAKLTELRSRANGPVITLENGDFIQGSPLSYYLAKRYTSAKILAEVSNQMQYDVHVIGNHEFNYGPAYLQETIATYQAPVLAANILNDQGEPYFGHAYTIIEKEGVKLAILGLTTQAIPNWEQPATIAGMHFERAVSVAKRYVPKLRQLADLVIVCYHGGFERALDTGEATELLTGENEGYELVHEVAGIDALFTGHQHRKIATQLNGVPVVQPGYRGSHVGEIRLTIEKIQHQWTIVDRQVRLHSVETTQPDPEILALVQPTETAVETWLDQPVGQVQGTMSIDDPMQARLVEHPYIEFINRVQMAATGAPISGTALFNNEGKGFKTQITMRDILTNYSYPNTLAVLRLTGAELKAALEKTAECLAVENGKIVFNPALIDPKPQYYNYDMYEGIVYTIDVGQPIGQRITRLLFNDAPIQPEQLLSVVVNQYRAVGGGNYTMFHPDKIIREVQLDMTELIVDYLKQHPLLEATTNQNFQVINTHPK